MTDSLVIYARGPCRGMGISPAIVKVFFKECKCPVGFEESQQSNFSCDCRCHPVVQTFTRNCNVKKQSFLREDTFWITYINHTDYWGYITYPHCPFDYCHPPRPGLWVNLNNPNGADDQCAEHRTGLLCGSCRSGYSLSVGSSHCITCNSQYNILITQSVVFCLGVLVFGLVLVVAILLLNLTVAVGSINGIIFYANVVAINRSIFLPFSKPNIATTFIAWLNLSIGFDVCLYVGMDEYIKTWLLLMFPTYLIALLVGIILISGCSLKFSQLIGKRNPAATLATLILLSYTKLLQAVINILSFTILEYPDSSHKAVWLPDANVQFLEVKHVPLFLVAITLVSLGLAYTVLLIIWQWLLKLSETRITCSWIRNAKLNSFIDTYHVPYNEKYRYWTGLLLLSRIIIYLVTAIDVSGDPRTRLLTIGLTITCLLTLKSLYGDSLYKKKLIDYLNTVGILNILFFTIVSFYSLGDQHRQKSAACASVSISIMIFVVILLYHIKSAIVEIKCIKTRKDLIIDKIKQRKLENIFSTATMDIEMNLESNFTSSEICLSPTRQKMQHNKENIQCQYRKHRNTNDLRESLLL